METRPITDITIGERVRRDMGDIADLAESIRKIGLLNAVVVTSDGTLVAGARRLAACRSLGWKTIPVTILHDKIGVQTS
jgi:ParB family chromosome partitioning protein